MTKRNTFIRLHERRELRQEGRDWLACCVWGALLAGLPWLTVWLRQVASHYW
jgi:hypothetical protein